MEHTNIFYCVQYLKTRDTFECWSCVVVEAEMLMDRCFEVCSRWLLAEPASGEFQESPFLLGCESLQESSDPFGESYEKRFIKGSEACFDLTNLTIGC